MVSIVKDKSIVYSDPGIHHYFLWNLRANINTIFFCVQCTDYTFSEVEMLLISYSSTVIIKLLLYVPSQEEQAPWEY